MSSSPAIFSICCPAVCGGDVYGEKMDCWCDVTKEHLLQAWSLQQCLQDSSQNISFSQCMLSHDALDVSLWFLGVVIIYSFVWSIIGNNCSKVDQIWSIIPWVYMWIFVIHHYLLHQIIHMRLVLVAILATLWGIRLTYNFWRRGGYGTFFTHEEDYRWPIVRTKMNSFVFLIFNFVFIASYQNILLWWIAMPTYIILSTHDSQTINQWDILFTILFLTLLLFETIADQQQYTFQQYKHSLTPEQRKQHSSASIRNGFSNEGLFRYSRHPNYFCEQSLWICVYLFSIIPAIPASISLASVTSMVATDLFNWTILGCIQLILLFQGSTNFSESITAEKYPAYRKYQQEVSQTIPWFPAPSSSPSASHSNKKKD
jgi:steroid 5-alpha reductase family enzyme